jgi:tetratricopeptide (TPR) repeat protein
VKLDADNAETRFHRALVQLKTGKNDEALADYREVIRLEPRPAEGYKKWDVNPAAAGESNIDRLEAALAKYKDEAAKHYLQGVALHKDGKLDEAVAEYDRAVLLYPRCPEVHYNRGLAYRRKGGKIDLEKAAVDFSQAIDLAPKFTVAYSNRGFVSFKLGEYDGALADFRKVLELDPQNADAKKSIEIIEGMLKQGDSP